MLVAHADDFLHHWYRFRIGDCQNRVFREVWLDGKIVATGMVPQTGMVPRSEAIQLVLDTDCNTAYRSIKKVKNGKWVCSAYSSLPESKEYKLSFCFTSPESNLG